MTSNLNTRSPPLAEVLFALAAAREADLHVSTPGRVERVDLSLGLVDVQPLLQGYRLDDTGARVPVSLPIINGVPLVFPGGGGFRATFPVAVNDYVLLVFSDRALDRWKSLGGEVDPITEASHDIADAIAIPGLKSFNAPWASMPTDHMTLGADVGQLIHMKNAFIELGNAAMGHYAVVGDIYRGAEDTMLSGIKTGLLALATAFTAAGVGFTAEGTVHGAYGPAFLALGKAAAATAAGVAATAMGTAAAAMVVAATACTDAAATITAFQAGAASYLSTVVKVTP